MSQETKINIKGFETRRVIDIGNLIFFQKFVLLEINEGAHLGMSEVSKIKTIVAKYYQDRPYGYLCNKETSYSVNPIAYNSLNTIEQLKCIAIIKQYSGSYEIEVERHFIKKPFEIFNTFDEASEWLNSFV